MKTLIIASVLAIAGFALPALAGPSVGSTSFHAGTFGARPPMHLTRTTAPYALKGRIDRDFGRDYRWRATTYRIPGRTEHLVYVREPVR